MFPTIPIQIQRKHPQAITPSYAHPGDRGMDVYSTSGNVIRPGSRAKFGIGWAIAVPSGYEIQVRPRSGLAWKDGVTVANSPGTIDDFRGELQVILQNNGADMARVEAGDRIAQLVVTPVLRAQFVEVESLPPSDRGDQGFGSTGVGHHWKSGDLVRDPDGSVGLVVSTSHRCLRVTWLNDDPDSCDLVDPDQVQPLAVDEVARLLHPGPLEFGDFGNG